MATRKKTEEATEDGAAAAEVPESAADSQTSAAAGAAETATREPPRRESATATRDDGGDRWQPLLESIQSTQREILDMVKPRESRDGAAVVVKGASETQPTEHQLVTTRAAPREQRETPRPKGRTLSLFKFRKS